MEKCCLKGGIDHGDGGGSCGIGYTFGIFWSQL